MTNYYNQIKKYLFASIFMVSLSYGFVSHAQPIIPGAQELPALTEEEVAMVEPTIINTSATDPCPEPKTSLAETPNDLKLIQEDITRFTLCLQRAQLLDRLNDLSKQNMDGIQTSLDEKIASKFGDTMPSDYLANVPFPDLSPANSPINNIQESSIETTPATQDNADWYISDITGQNGKLEAKLIDGTGNIVYATVGQTLPNSDIKIKSVTMTDVKITANGQETSLNWNNVNRGTALNVQ